MFNWLKEYWDIKASYMERKREATICESCETLKMQLAIANDEKRQLLNQILYKPEPEVKVDTSELKPVSTLSHTGSWRVRQQMLEAEDREKAKILNREMKSPVATISTADLEKELDIVATEREAQTGVKNA